jgi:hypothetical protein
LFGIGDNSSSSRSSASIPHPCRPTPVLAHSPLRLCPKILTARLFSDFHDSGLSHALILFPSTGRSPHLPPFVGCRTSSPASGAARGQFASLLPLAAGRPGFSRTQSEVLLEECPMPPAVTPWLDLRVPGMPICEIHLQIILGDLSILRKSIISEALNVVNINT